MINKYNGITKSHTINNINKIYDNNTNTNNKLNIVLDLDNTIIYSKIIDSIDIVKIKYFELFKNKNLIGKFDINNKTYLVYIRQYFSYFLNTIKMYFNLYIYTNSQSIYCINIINLLKKKYQNFDIKKILCKNTTNSSIKQLSIICDNQDDLHFLNNIPTYSEFIKKTIIIDDNKNVWKYDSDNLIDIKAFNEIDINTNLLDDTLLIITNRLFLIYNFFFFNTKLDDNNDVKKIISKYKLYSN
jgi:TFIIF-interacting CTD phosphatase-like protein